MLEVGKLKGDVRDVVSEFEMCRASSDFESKLVAFRLSKLTVEDRIEIRMALDIVALPIKIP